MVTVVKEESSSSALAVVLVLLAVAAIGFCVYFFGSGGKLSAPASNTTINLPDPPAVNNTRIEVPAAPAAPALPTPSGGDAE